MGENKKKGKENDNKVCPLSSQLGQSARERPQNSQPGNRTLVYRVTGGDTNHFTNRDYVCLKSNSKLNH